MERSVEVSKSNVLNLSQFRKKKAAESDVARGRTPLVINHSDGKVGSSDRPDASPESSEFGDRLQKIRASLDRINTSMADLRRVSREMKSEKSEPMVDRRK